MKLVTFRPLAIASVLALGAAACGSLSASADKPGTLATVAGSITNPKSLAISGAFRVAVVWDASGQALGDGGYANDHRTTQDIAVTPVFPAQFQLNLTELPNNLQPFQQMFGAPPSVDLRGAGGYVVAYDDLNRNGKLDLVTSASPGFVDSVLGQATSPLLYLEGTMPTDLSLVANAKDTGGNLPALGFNLFVNYCVSGKTPPVGSSCDAAFDWVPVNTPISIALSADPTLSNVMCQEMPSSATSDNENGHRAGEFPTAFPEPSDPSVKCAPDGKGYTYTADKTVTPPGICQASITYHNVDTYSLAAGAAAPSGWPCTVH